MLKTIVFVLIACPFLATSVSLGSAEILRWETSPAPGTAIAFAARHVLVGGTSLAAYDARTGEKEWEISSDPPSDISALTEDHQKVFAAGRTAGPQGDLFVAAFDPKTGEQLWSDRVDYAGGTEFADAVAAERGRMFVVGTTFAPETFTPSAFIRAYDARTGAQLWDDLAEFAPSCSCLTAIAVEGHVYLAVGAGFGGPVPFIIRAYDARTGELLWQEDASPGPVADGATVVAADRHRVFTGGTGGLQQGFVVRGYDRRDGRLIWEDSPSGGDINFVTGIALHRGRLIVTGWALILNVAPESDDDPNLGSFVSAYDPMTGSVLWQETAHQVGRGFINLSLAAARDSVLLAGSRINVGPGVPDFFSQRFLVRALDIETGAFQWEDLEEGPGTALAVEARNDLVTAVGEVTDPDGVARSVIRAYDLSRRF